MTRKEIEKIVADNPGKPLYAEYIGGTLPGGATFGLMHEVSKTQLIKASKSITGFRIGTFNEFRSDLKGKLNNGDQVIVLFNLKEDKSTPESTATPAQTAGAVIADAINKQTITAQPVNTPLEIEGDRNTWHIRLYARMGTVEVWCLYNGEDLMSSPSIKSAVTQWRDEELAKLVKKPVVETPVANIPQPPPPVDPLAPIDLGEGRTLKYQRSAKNPGKVRAVVVDTNGTLIAAGPVVEERNAKASRFAVCSEVLKNPRSGGGSDLMSMMMSMMGGH